MHWLAQQWYRPAGWFSYCMSPLSGLYKIAVTARASAYQHGFKQTVHFPVPVIVVGGMTVGGTGKTPMVAWLARWLQEEGGQPGLVSRGYGGQAHSWPQPVFAESDPQWVGDESVMLVQQTRCPMVVGPDRVAAVERLLTDFSCDVVISDDGLQHHALGRDIEIVVMDGERRLGNGYCLPAGPLRESRARLRTVDFVMVNGESKENEYAIRYTFHDIRHVKDPQKNLEISALHDKTVHAVAGIGHPERFFQQLRAHRLSIIAHAFPDHYVYRPQDLDFGREALVLMTEKDAVKCRSFADERHWYLPITVQVDPRFPAQLGQRMAAVLLARRPTLR